MKVITLCGSTKFRKEFEKVMMEETLKGNIVISVGLFGHETGLKMTGPAKKMLDKMHFKKIDMADEIFVVNPNGYIGLSTCDEIHYALSQNKSVRYLEALGHTKLKYKCGCNCDPNYGHAPSCMFDNWDDDVI